MEETIKVPVRETGQEGGWKTFEQEDAFVMEVSGNLSELKILYPTIWPIISKGGRDDSTEGKEQGKATGKGYS